MAPYTWRLRLLLSSLALAVAATAAINPLPPAIVYTCDYPASVEEKVTRADSIFYGRAINKEYSWHAFYGRNGNAQVTFAVQRVWKGPVAHTLTVHAVEGDGGLGLIFHVGAEYLVYAERGETGGFGSGY